MASWTLQSGPRLSTLPPLQSDTRTLWPLASVESSCTSVLHRSKLSASPHTHVRWRTYNKTRTLCSAGWDLNHFNFSKVKDFLVDFGNCHVSSQSETCWERNCFRMLLTFRASSIDEIFLFPSRRCLRDHSDWFGVLLPLTFCSSVFAILMMSI